ncbi:MAG: type II toxin-antitoxin system HicB family antitoxin [bacterium]|nr:type II toxin-antitoxin system HicB family antitoxin [bacterium]
MPTGLLSAISTPSNRRSSPVVKNIKIIVEKHADGYVAYPVGLKGVVVAEGDTYEEALADAKSAIEFHVETFGREVLEEEDEASEVFVAEMAVAV